MIYKIQPKTSKMTPMDLHMTFDFAYDLQKKKFNFDHNSQINVYLRKDKTSKSKGKKIF